MTQNNNFGAFPDEFARLSCLEHLYANNNALTGIKGDHMPSFVCSVAQEKITRPRLFTPPTHP